MSKTILLNIYDNIQSPKISKRANKITIKEWFDMIKYSDDSSDILKARKAGKYTPEYDKIKHNLLAITYNFNFKHPKKNNENITGATGLMYIDVDPEKGKAFDFDINKLDKSKLFAYYRSFGGNGYCILVQVNGLRTDLTNFNSTYKSIMNDLGLAKYYDPQAVKATQFNVLSYDPNLFINESSYLFEAIEEVDEVFNLVTDNHFTPPSIVIREKKIYSDREGGNIRFDNLNEIDITGEYAFNWNGYTYINCWLPYKKITTGKRNSTLLSYTNNLVWLNPELTKSGAESILLKINQIKCEEPMQVGEVKSIVSSIFRYKSEGTLKPIINRKSRKIVFAQYSNLTKDEKLETCRVLLSEKKQNDSLEKIDKIIRNWDFDKYGKISQEKIYKNYPVSKKTIEKYHPTFKDDIDKKNKEFKEGAVYMSGDAHSTSTPATTQNKPLQAIIEPENITLQDVKVDTASGLKMANYTLYQRSINLIETTAKIILQSQLRQLLFARKQGEVTIEAGDYKFSFRLHPGLETIEFLSIADGSSNLLLAA